MTIPTSSLGGTGIQSPPEARPQDTASCPPNPPILGGTGIQNSSNLGETGIQSPPDLGKTSIQSPLELEGIGIQSPPELGDLGGEKDLNEVKSLAHLGKREWGDGVIGNLLHSVLTFAGRAIQRSSQTDEPAATAYCFKKSIDG